jgi:hypothetical protein
MRSFLRVEIACKQGEKLGLAAKPHMKAPPLMLICWPVM